MSSFDEKILNAIKAIENATGLSNPFAGKYVSILGDCISSYEGYVPDGLSSGHYTEFSDVSKMWWYQLLMKLGANLCVNYSDADFKIAGTDDKSVSYSHYGSNLTQKSGDKFIKADGKTYTLGNGTQDPDIIIVYLGLNDYINNAKFTDFTHSILSSGVKKNSDLTDDTVYQDVSTAYERILSDIIGSYPYASIYCITPNMARYGSGNYPFPNDANWSMPLLDELIRNLCIKFAAKHVSLLHLDVRSTWASIGSDNFLMEDKIHPTEEGHKLIANFIYQAMITDYVSWGTRNDIN